MTLIDVLDTAVKIGLGAAVAGIATFWTTRLKTEHEANLETKRYARSQFERLSEAFERVGQAIAIIVISMNESVASDTRSAKTHAAAYAMFKDVYQELAGVRALSTLIGDIELGSSINQMHLAVDALHEATHIYPIDEEALNLHLAQLDKRQDEIRILIRSLYEKNAA
jgi:hypothetical protein